MLHTINGFSDPQFRAVTSAFKAQLNQHGGGGALCVLWQGKPVIDIWGGDRDQNSPWLEDTPVVCYSTTKGVLVSLLHAVLHAGKVNYDTTIAKIWPSFKHSGKSDLTIRQLLHHQLGLFDTSQCIPHIADAFDWDQMVWSLARATPQVRYVNQCAYHAMTFGWLAGELIRRLTGLRPGQYLASEFRQVMGRHNWIGVPERHLPLVAKIMSQPEAKNQRVRLTHRIHNRLNQQLQRTLLLNRNLRTSLGPTLVDFDPNHPSFLINEVPALNGVFTARGLAKLYQLLIEQNQRQKRTWFADDLFDFERTPKLTGRDRVLQLPMHWRLGYHRIFNLRRPTPRAFGHYGLGGSGAFCDLDRQLAVGFNLNTLWGAPLADYRMTQLTGLILQAVDTTLLKN